MLPACLSGCCCCMLVLFCSRACLLWQCYVFRDMEFFLYLNSYTTFLIHTHAPCTKCLCLTKLDALDCQYPFTIALHALHSLRSVKTASQNKLQQSYPSSYFFFAKTTSPGPRRFFPRTGALTIARSNLMAKLSLFFLFRDIVRNIQGRKK